MGALETIIGYRSLEPIKTCSLLYADDIVLMTNTDRKIQTLTDLWVEEIEGKQTKVNISKSKTMIRYEKN